MRDYPAAERAADGPNRAFSATAATVNGRSASFFLKPQNDRPAEQRFRAEWTALSPQIDDLRSHDFINLWRNASKMIPAIAEEEDCFSLRDFVARSDSLTRWLLRAERDAKKFSGRDVATAAWSFSNAGIHPGKNFLERIVSRAGRTLDEFSPRGLTELGVSLAQLAYLPEPTFLAAWTEKRAAVPCEQTDHCAMPLWTACVFGALGGQGMAPLARQLADQMTGADDLRLKDKRILSSAAILFGMDDLQTAPPRQTDAHSYFERRLAANFQRAGARILPVQDGFIPGIDHLPDISLDFRNRGVVVEADGPSHFNLAVRSGRSHYNGSTLLQTALMRLCAPQTRIVRFPEEMEAVANRNRGYPDLLRDFANAAPGAYQVAPGRISVRLESILPPVTPAPIKPAA